MTLSRRKFLKSVAVGGLATLTAPALVRAANTRPHIVVVGGGFAGATVAKYLRHWSTAVDVTLIEANPHYYSPILSNLVVTQQMNLDQLTFDYAQLRSRYGINIIHDWVDNIDANNYTINLSQQGKLAYDRLILAPGISFQTIDGLDSQKTPHAWQAGEQTVLLQQQLANMPDNGTFVMTVPLTPYRCPPGPYERACVVADYLKRNKPNAKVIVLDANADIVVEKHTFGNAFNQTYADRLQYIPNAMVNSVDSDQRLIVTSQGSFQADVLNVIPAQQAGRIILDNGLANDASGRWAGINPLSYESTKAAGIHIIGDSQATGQPKAGHIANAEAKICADAILRLISGASPYANPVTNSACYSPISAETASWLTAIFRYDSATGSMKLVPESFGESAQPTREQYQAMFDWANNLFADTFS
ncbi:MAG: FAD-dependent oxidoreductase [bacterium]